MARSALRLAPVSGASAKLDLKPGTTTVAIAEIRLRRDGDSRPLTARHVVELVESIAILGLLEPVVLDTTGHLLAGGHRLAALQLLAESAPVARRRTFLIRCGAAPEDKPGPELVALADRLAMLGEAPLAEHYPKGRVPVQVVDVTGRGGADLALAVEAAENNVRRQYTPDEIQALADRFKAAGYTHRDGRPAEGEKTMMNALEAAVGRSKRQIQRALAGPKKSKKTKWELAVAAMERAATRITTAKKRPDNKQAKAMLAAAKGVLEAAGG